jgi:predicted dehydrogenase/threonine dehydrogenase-like Zn-dependent dehydrogenase
VACAGSEFALHAEVNWVPTNLCVPVPEGVAPQHAAFGTLGAVAMQGLRQAEVGLGDTACVIGLGLIGQLVVRLLMASGARVVGLDVLPDRCRLAEEAGALICSAPDEEGLAAVERILSEASGGLGADTVFLAAGGPSRTPVEAAARLARDRARVVDIGKCKLDLPWNAYYEKELEVRFSRSYGPGRYDPAYELDGVDYPAGYVRWTERRNLACFVDLLATGAVDVEPLISDVFPIGDAVSAYDRLDGGSLEGIAFLFEYPQLKADDTGARNAARPAELSPRPGGRDRPGRTRRQPQPYVRVGFVGAGNYASTMLLPHLVARRDVRLTAVATNRSLSAVNAQRKFGFERISTDPDDVISDGDIDAVFLVTRHSSHAELVCRALQAGKAVFVEKPLALTGHELDRIVETVEATGNDRLMVGFNRRFAPILVEMKVRFGEPSGPTVARYLINSGPIGEDSWYRNADKEGSRFAGEGGHFIDTLSWWIGADPLSATALPAGGDDLTLLLRYPDGSTGAITYLTSGHPRYPKETFEVSCDGRSGRLDNFKRATVWRGRKVSTRRAFGAVDKGQAREVDAFLAAVSREQPMPILLPSVLATTRATIDAAMGAMPVPDRA